MGKKTGLLAFQLLAMAGPCSFMWIFFADVRADAEKCDLSNGMRAANGFGSVFLLTVTIVLPVLLIWVIGSVLSLIVAAVPAKPWINIAVQSGFGVVAGFLLCLVVVLGASTEDLYPVPASC